MRNNSKIYRSLIKNGYSNFKLEILEYCEVDILLEREQYYLDRFNPEYNILKIAGSHFCAKAIKKWGLNIVKLRKRSWV